MARPGFCFSFRLSVLGRQQSVAYPIYLSIFLPLVVSVSRVFLGGDGDPGHRFDGALDILLDHETLKTGESYDDCVGIYLFFFPFLVRISGSREGTAY